MSELNLGPLYYCHRCIEASRRACAVERVLLTGFFGTSSARSTHVRHESKRSFFLKMSAIFGLGASFNL